MYLHNTARARARERLVFTWPAGLSTLLSPPSRSSSATSLQTEPPRPLAAHPLHNLSVLQVPVGERFHGCATIKRTLISFLAGRSTVRNKTFASLLLQEGRGWINNSVHRAILRACFQPCFFSRLVYMYPR